MKGRGGIREKKYGIESVKRGFREHKNVTQKPETNPVNVPEMKGTGEDK